MSLICTASTKRKTEPARAIVLPFTLRNIQQNRKKKCFCVATTPSTTHGLAIGRHLQHVATNPWCIRVPVVFFCLLLAEEIELTDTVVVGAGPSTPTKQVDEPRHMNEVIDITSLAVSAKVQVLSVRVRPRACVCVCARVCACMCVYKSV